VPGVALVVAMDRIALGSSASILTLQNGRIAATDLQGGESAFLAPALRDAITTHAPAGDALVLEIDPAVPYATVTRAIYAAGQASRSRLSIRVRHGGQLGLLPVSLPGTDGVRVASIAALGGALDELLDEPIATTTTVTPGLPPGAPEPTTVEPLLEVLPITPTVSLERAGTRVSTDDGDLTPGCDTVAPHAVTVPATNGALDLATLASCLAHVHAAHPVWTTITIAADPDLPFADVARAMAVARGTDGAPAFTSIQLAASVR
jgi:hypothetical protein